MGFFNNNDNVPIDMLYVKPEPEKVFVAPQTDVQFFYTKMRAAEKRCVELEKELDALETSSVGELKDELQLVLHNLTYIESHVGYLKGKVIMLKGKDVEYVYHLTDQVYDRLAKETNHISEVLNKLDTTE